MLAAALADTASAASGADLPAWLIAQGPIGVLALAIGYGWKRERDRADSERERADAERASAEAVIAAERAKTDELVDRFLDRIVPALEGSTRATEELLRYSRELGR